MCSMNRSSQRFDSTAAMLAHLAEHKAAGDVVPDSCIEELEADRESSDAYIEGHRDAKATMKREG
jgi:hypothetical protein